MSAGNGRRWLCLLLMAALAGCDNHEAADSVGFAGLAAQSSEQGRQGEVYLQPGPGDTIELPADLGPHPQHRIEWWYLTANLETPDGESLGVQWTQFRQSQQPRARDRAPPEADSWPLEAVWMAHAAVSFQGEHRFAERLARGGVGHAGATAVPFAVWLDHWRLQEQVSGSGEPVWELEAGGRDWHYDLQLRPTGPPVLHGDDGFSAKSASGEGSMYFSYTDLEISGRVTLDGQTHEVQGLGWFDREWSSQFLRSDQQGWDWLALHLDSGARLMGFQLREGDAGFRSGTWVSADGDSRALSGQELTLTPLQQRQTDRGDVPVSWRIEVPSEDLDLTVEAVPGDYWNNGLYPYWESPIRVRQTGAGAVIGSGYLEMTGY